MRWKFTIWDFYTEKTVFDQLNSWKVSVFDDIHCTIEWTVILVFSEIFQENKVLNLKTANILNFISYAQFHNLKPEIIKKVSFLSFLRLLSLVFEPRESNGGFEGSQRKLQNFPNFEEELSILGGNELLCKVAQRDRDPLNNIYIKDLIWFKKSYLYDIINIWVEWKKIQNSSFLLLYKLYSIKITNFKNVKEEDFIYGDKLDISSFSS